MLSSKSRPKTRSPALRTPTTPSQFFPPSYFAAAAGVTYPPNRDDDGQTLSQQEHYPFSSNASYECSNRTRRKSRHGGLGLMESHLLPTLSDTVERMTRPPSQVIPSSPFRPVSSCVARTPSISSQSSSACSVRAEPQNSTPVASQTPIIQPVKSILKAHTTSDQHLQVRRAHRDDVYPPTDHIRKARSPAPTPPDPLLIERARQMQTPSRPKLDGSLRTGRARSRTDPGTLPKGSPATHGKSTQAQPSGIPRRVGVPPSPGTSRIPVAAQASNSSSETPGMDTSQREKRRLFVTNAEISSSSSSECQVPLMRYPKPKTLSRTDSQSSAETQLRPPRFGLGLGLSGVGESKNLVKMSGQKSLTKMTSNEPLPRHTNSPGNKRQQRDSTPKRRDRSPSRNARVNNTDGQRRQRELLSLVHTNPNYSSGCDSRPSSLEGSQDRCLISDGSGDYLRSALDDSGSEYSPAEEDDHTRRASIKWETKQGQRRSKATSRQSHINLACDDTELPVLVDEQYTPKAPSTSFSRQNQGQIWGYPTAPVNDTEFLVTESSTLASDEDEGSIDKKATRPTPERYSSELSRIMAVSLAAATRQRQAFGITSSREDYPSESSDLSHADSDLSLVGGDTWQDECDELATGSLLQRSVRTSGTDERGRGDPRSSMGEPSLSTAQTRSSFSQESLYSTPNSPTRRSSRGIIAPESPPTIATVREQQWQTLERHILASYGEAEARRQQFVWELTESEDSFVTQLQNMIQLFILPLRVRDTRVWVSGIPSDVMKLFDWLDDIVRVHAHLSSALTARQTVDHPRLQMLSDIFRSFIPRLETYQSYLVKLEFTASVIDGLIQEGKNDFGDFIKLQEALDCCQGWTLEKYLIEPVNRLAQYPEVFRRLLQLTPKSHPDYMSTLSLYHAAKLTIRVLSEVKDREDAYEFVKAACSGIQDISSAHLVHRERRLLIRGSLTCVRVNDDEQATSFEPLVDMNMPGVRRADRLSKAIHIWRGRSNSIKSSASTVVSFETAPSTFDVRAQPVGTPVFRVESEPVDVEVYVFTDLVLLVSRPYLEGQHDVDDMEPLPGFGLSRVVSVLDEIDRRACITLDLAPLTPRALEDGHVQSTGPVVTIALSGSSQRTPDERVVLVDWLVPLRRCCQYTLRALSSLNTTNALVDRCDAAQKPVLSILAAGLPFPKSPSMQIEESERGLAGDSERQEREERGWWSKRFHEVLSELSKGETM